jgi:hypothetical protein
LAAKRADHEIAFKTLLADSSANDHRLGDTAE